MAHIRRFYCSTLLFLTLTSLGFSQSASSPQSLTDRPKLVVGIVVDQMRYQYLPAFYDMFGDDGFKRLLDDGYSFQNMHYNYFPTYTGPGHAAIYTGTTPSVNGIVGNNWYDRPGRSDMYVVSDSMVTTIGGQGKVGQMSPANLLSTTITDELKQAIPQSKVIGLSLKDRGAVLPAGHLGDGAYWYDDETGHFVSSTWYADALPDWMKAFNDRNLAQTYSRETWTLLRDSSVYHSLYGDDAPYEGTFSGEEAPVFPHAMGGSLARIKSAPYGNTLLTHAALAALEGEALGTDTVTDFLAISYSSTDYVGHQFGPNSVELMDTYLRLDREIAELLQALDEQVGEGNYVLFLTADHGVVDPPASLRNRGLPGGLFDSQAAIDALERHLAEQFGPEEWIDTYQNQQVYLNHEQIAASELSRNDIEDEVAHFLRSFDGVASTATSHDLATKEYANGLQAMYQRGFYPKRSGDVYIQLAPGWLDSNYETGTSHGSPYSYDTHVPLLFYGWNIPAGKQKQKTVIPQLAPTLSNMLQIEFPSGSDEQVLIFE